MTSWQFLFCFFLKMAMFVYNTQFICCFNNYWCCGLYNVYIYIHKSTTNFTQQPLIWWLQSHCIIILNESLLFAWELEFSSVKNEEDDKVNCWHNFHQFICDLVVQCRTEPSCLTLHQLSKILHISTVLLTAFSLFR